MPCQGWIIMSSVLVPLNSCGILELTLHLWIIIYYTTCLHLVTELCFLVLQLNWLLVTYKKSDTSLCPSITNRQSCEAQKLAYIILCTYLSYTYVPATNMLRPFKRNLPTQRSFPAHLMKPHGDWRSGAVDIYIYIISS